MEDKQKGFSLAEVLIAVSLAIFVAAVMVGMFRGIDKRVSTAQVNSDFQAFQMGLRSFIDEQTAMNRKVWFDEGGNPYGSGSYHFWPGTSNIHDEDAVLNRYIEPDLFRVDADPWNRRYHYHFTNNVKDTGNNDTDYHCAIIWSEGPRADNGKTGGVSSLGGSCTKTSLGAFSLNGDYECVISGNMDDDNPYMILRINPNKIVSVQEVNLQNKQ